MDISDTAKRHLETGRPLLAAFREVLLAVDDRLPGTTPVAEAGALYVATTDLLNNTRRHGNGYCQFITSTYSFVYILSGNFQGDVVIGRCTRL